jgi:hypothetical protein
MYLDLAPRRPGERLLIGQSGSESAQDVETRYRCASSPPLRRVTSIEAAMSA